MALFIDASMAEKSPSLTVSSSSDESDQLEHVTIIQGGFGQVLPVNHGAVSFDNETCPIEAQVADEIDDAPTGKVDIPAVNH
jgi:hypothetical protein